MTSDHGSDVERDIERADRANGEYTERREQAGPRGVPDTPLEEHPKGGQMPSDVDVQAKRQEPMD
jgi:hypothetical protein